MPPKVKNVENFIKLAKGIDVPIGIIIAMANYWNTLSDEEKEIILDQEGAF